MDDIRLEADISLENGNFNKQVNRRRNERNRLRRDEINNRQNASIVVLRNFLMKHIFLCYHNGKVVLSQPSSFPQDLEDLFKGNYADKSEFFKI